MSWQVRKDSVAFPDGQLLVEYEGLVDVCTIILHHSGCFLLDIPGKKDYLGGSVDYIDYVEAEKVTKEELRLMADFLGLQGPLQFYVSMNGYDNCDGLEHVSCDFNAGPLISAVISKELTVTVYVDHDGLDPRDIVCHPDESVAGPVTDDLDAIIDEFTDGDEQREEPANKPKDQREEPANEPKEQRENDLLKYSMEKLVDEVIEDEDSDGEISMGDDSELSDYEVDSDFDCEKDNADFYKFVDSEDDCGKKKDLKGKRPMTRSQSEGCSKEKQPVKQPENSGQQKPRIFKVFNEKTDMENVQLYVGLCFKDIPICRAAVRQYAIETGRSLYFPCNNIFKVQAKCKQEGCPWMFYASRVPKDDTVVVKTLVDEHTCVRQERVTQATSQYLSKRYLQKLKSDPKWPVKSMIEIMQAEVGCIFTKWQMYRVKKFVAKMGDGDAIAQFRDLYRYAAEVFRSNPNTTFRIKSKALSDEAVFQRLYICWNAVKLGMAAGNRRIICLDGCHLKTEYGGVLLSAVGVDGNNQMYPIAYAIVEKEKYSSWLWFLELLVSDLGITESSAHLWTVMSDKQKGLVDAVSTLLPYCDHRFCVRHLVANFKLVHKGLPLENLIWKAARSTRVVDFESTMEDVKKRNVAAFEWLSKKSPNHWSMSHFNTLNHTAMISNNMSESFNAMIGQARTKGIIYMLEEIRKMLMKSIGLKKQEMEKHSGYLCPNIQQILDKQKVKSYGFAAHWNGQHEFEVTGPSERSFYVHIGDRICSCRKWQLTGIPCPHVIACFNHMRYKPEDYVEKCYTRETYLKVYSNYMTPMYGRDEWPAPPQMDMPPLVPPTVTKMPGRPKKHSRRKEPGELIGTVRNGRMSRRGVVMTCTLCKEEGHNKRGCPLNKSRVQWDEGLGIPSATQESSENVNEASAPTSQPTTTQPPVRRSPRLKSTHPIRVEVKQTKNKGKTVASSSNPTMKKQPTENLTEAPAVHHGKRKRNEPASASEPAVHPSVPEKNDNVKKQKSKGKEVMSAFEAGKRSVESAFELGKASSQPTNVFQKLPVKRQISFSQPLFSTEPADQTFTSSPPYKVIHWEEGTPECVQQ